MNSKQRFLTALDRKKPDRLPVTTHHVMPSFLSNYLGGMDYQDFFDQFELDPIKWIVAPKPDITSGDYFDPNHLELGFLEPRRISSDNWRIEMEDIPNQEYETTRYNFITPQKVLSLVLQKNEHTSWVSERLIKEKRDIELISRYAPKPLCDVERVNAEATQYGDRGLIRGFIPGFDVYGQSGCWQDAAVLFGIENLIMESFSDPDWLHTFLKILQDRKTIYIQSMEGAQFDLIEHGGGDASSTVISPQILDEFVLPYDAPLTELAQQMNQRVVYHTCGGMMPFLESIASMKPDAMETFTPPEMGGDADLREAKQRIGDEVCMIGGFDQFHYFKDCNPEKTRQEVRRCFEAAGTGGGYILAPSDHFFNAELTLIEAFSDEAHQCQYE
jgi:uroporphyrinogen-III decarboxylase